jgi:hypothetical protein
MRVGTMLVDLYGNGRFRTGSHFHQATGSHAFG